MKTIQFGAEDEGFLQVDLPDGGMVRLDVYIASERFGRAITEGGTSAKDQADRLAEAMTEFGVPSMSYMRHFHIFNECKKMAEEAQKKEGLTQPAPDGPGSPSITE